MGCMVNERLCFHFVLSQKRSKPLAAQTLGIAVKQVTHFANLYWELWMASDSTNASMLHLNGSSTNPEQV